MRRVRIDSRVGVVATANNRTVRLYGYGRYKGHEIPPAEVSPLLARQCVLTARLELDSGETIWGCEAAWDREERVKKFIGRRRVKMVPVSSIRNGNGRSKR